ncbi:hypothetical protein K2173_010800 [Erythroxylum novogranatense]|uniref:Uncharacterized protein n=1 Tax=Erythroxylum novogranatense TaxID=1862640 RepID=A0AAV8T1G0_9ROSI|nr:hypothetical protein K2173_010800 [Erythroxylum novogranatense]
MWRRPWKEDAAMPLGDIGVSVHNYWPMLKLRRQQPTTKKQVCVNVEKVTAVAPDGAAVG